MLLQALAKQFAEILHFTLKFDDLKVLPMCFYSLKINCTLEEGHGQIIKYSEDRQQTSVFYVKHFLFVYFFICLRKSMYILIVAMNLLYIN